MPIFWIMLVCTGMGALAFGYVDKRGIRGIKNRYNQTKVLIILTFATMIFFASMRSVVSDTAAYNADANTIPAKPINFPNTIENIKFSTAVSNIIYFVSLYKPVASRKVQIGNNEIDR